MKSWAGTVAKISARTNTNMLQKANASDPAKNKGRSSSSRFKLKGPIWHSFWLKRAELGKPAERD